MKKITLTFLTTFSLLAGSPAVLAESSGHKIVLNNHLGGDAGWATLRADGEKTRFTVTLPGDSAATARPDLMAEVRAGNCDAQDAELLEKVDMTPSASLGSSFTASPGIFQGSGELSQPLKTLDDGQHSLIVVAASAADGKRLACGNIQPPEAETE